MLEWMIAIVAVCGALAGFTALFIVLRFVMQLRTDSAVAAQIARVLPRARVHRLARCTGRKRERGAAWAPRSS